MTTQTVLLTLLVAAVAQVVVSGPLADDSAPPEQTSLAQHMINAVTTRYTHISWNKDLVQVARLHSNCQDAFLMAGDCQVFPANQGSIMLMVDWLQNFTEGESARALLDQWSSKYSHIGKSSQFACFVGTECIHNSHNVTIACVFLNRYMRGDGRTPVLKNVKTDEKSHIRRTKRDISSIITVVTACIDALTGLRNLAARISYRSSLLEVEQMQDLMYTLQLALEKYNSDPEKFPITTATIWEITIQLQAILSPRDMPVDNSFKALYGSVESGNLLEAFERYDDVMGGIEAWVYGHASLLYLGPIGVPIFAGYVARLGVIEGRKTSIDEEMKDTLARMDTLCTRLNTELNLGRY